MRIRGNDLNYSKYKFWVAGFSLGVFVSCSTGFGYRYYGLEIPTYQGMLLGPEQKDDIPFSVCQPDGVEKGKCMVMLADEFFALKRDFKETKQRLIECEREQ